MPADLQGGQLVKLSWPWTSITAPRGSVQVTRNASARVRRLRAPRTGENIMTFRPALRHPITVISTRRASGRRDIRLSRETGAHRVHVRTRRNLVRMMTRLPHLDLPDVRMLTWPSARFCAKISGWHLGSRADFRFFVRMRNLGSLIDCQGSSVTALGRPVKLGSGLKMNR